MATSLRPYTHILVYLLILCYSWTLSEGVLCELYLSIAHTAQVMNGDLFSTDGHHHSQEIAQIQLERFQAGLAAQEELPPQQQKATQAPEKQTVYSNQLADPDPLLDREETVSYFWLGCAITNIRQLPTPPPKAA